MSSEDDIENENDKTLISSNEDNENKIINWYLRWNNWQIKIIWRPN